MNEIMETGSSFATWVDTMLKHASFVSLTLSLLGPWGFAIFMSFPIHRAVKEPELATFYARCACVLGSFIITAATWPNEFRWPWAFTMAMVSPLLGMVVLWKLSKWAPELYAWLAMKKTTP